MELYEIYARAISKGYRVKIAQSYSPSTITITMFKGDAQISFSCEVLELQNNYIMQERIVMMEQELKRYGELDNADSNDSDSPVNDGDCDRR